MDLSIKKLVGEYEYCYMCGFVIVTPIKKVTFKYQPNVNQEPEVEVSDYIVDEIIKMGKDELFQLSTTDKHILNVLSFIQEMKDKGK